MSEAATAAAAPTVLEVRDLVVEIAANRSVLRAIDGISFQIRKGEILGLVGESGSGKSMTGLSILGLVAPPVRIASGQILFNGINLRDLAARQLRRIRGSGIAMIPQNPMSTLSPTLRIETQMVDAILAHETISRRDAWRRCRDALGRLGVPTPDERMTAYPHELSGGLLQRIVIAIAMLNHPELVIADEPTTALDVTIQAQILHEIQTLCAENRTALIWISHDLSVVAGMADRIAVMYGGAIVEEGPADRVLDHPMHRYTEGLIQSVPSRGKGNRRFSQIPGTPPRLSDRVDGCRFRRRCAHATATCGTSPPRSPLAAEHWVSCHHPARNGVD